MSWKFNVWCQVFTAYLAPKAPAQVSARLLPGVWTWDLGRLTRLRSCGWKASLGYHGVNTWDEVEDEDAGGDVRLYAPRST